MAILFVVLGNEIESYGPCTPLQSQRSSSHGPNSHTRTSGRSSYNTSPPNRKQKYIKATNDEAKSELPEKRHREQPGLWLRKERPSPNANTPMRLIPVLHTC